MPRDLENLKRLIHEHGFGEVADQILQHAYPSIRVETQRVDDEVKLAIGQSKMGGRPDLPPMTSWPHVPTYKGGVESLPFIAQFDLAALTPHDAETLLPPHGMLYFFGDPWRGKDGEHGKVLLYTGDTAALQRAPYPDDVLHGTSYGWVYGRYMPCALTLVSEINIDFDAKIDYPSGKDWRDALALFAAAAYTQPSPPHSVHVNRLLGILHGGVGDMQFLCRPADQLQLADPAQSEWRLLFQVSSDKNASMMWSDAGTIYFFIRERDLMAHIFDDICLAFYSS